MATPAARAVPEQLAEGILAGQRRALARAITLIESSRADHREQAAQLLELLGPHAGGATRVGISGVPGAGKSTFIEAFGLQVIERGRKLAVLSVDPSSALSGGSVLGDKTRMELLSRDSRAFIRPSPAGRTLGGVARRTRESILLCEAAGFDLLLVETVGVGQSEIAVAEMTDMFLLLLLPGGGDDLQGIKRGIMEMADLILVNKADGDLLPAANRTVSDYRNALRLLHPRSKHWQVPVRGISSLERRGVDQTWQTIDEFWQTMQAHGEIERRRAEQARAWLWNEIQDGLMTAFRAAPAVQQALPTVEDEVAGQRLPPTTAARRLLDLLIDKSNNQGT